MKAQVQVQPLMLIFGLFVAVLVLFFGYKAITSVIDTGTNSKITLFYSKIERDANLYKDFGSRSDDITYELPSNIRTACFFSLDADPNSNPMCPANAVACEFWRAKSGSMLLIPAKESSQKIPLLDVDTGGFCKQITRGLITLRYEGLGLKTKLYFVKT